MSKNTGQNSSNDEQIQLVNCMLCQSQVDVFQAYLCPCCDEPICPKCWEIKRYG